MTDTVAQFIATLIQLGIMVGGLLAFRYMVAWAWPKHIDNCNWLYQRGDRSKLVRVSLRIEEALKEDTQW